MASEALRLAVALARGAELAKERAVTAHSHTGLDHAAVADYGRMAVVYRNAAAILAEAEGLKSTPTSVPS